MRLALLLTTLLGCALLVLAWGSRHAGDPSHADHVVHQGVVTLAVRFAHADHVAQQCLDCHHNFADDTGTGMCFDCHRSDPAVNTLIEEQFHELCRDCHVHEARLPDAPHGPTRACSGCHVPDEAP